jgi:RES domain
VSATSVRVVDPPAVWRIGHATDPFKARYSPAESLTAADLNDPKVGNRFDSPAPGLYGVIYFGTQLECCFAETLSRLRPNPRLVAIARMDEAEDQNLMPLGEVPADWRHRRLAIRAEIDGPPFLDVEHMDSRTVMEPDLRLVLNAFGYEELDIPAVMSHDRRLTRWISWWAWSRVDEHGNPAFGGIRYTSRLSDEWECWAVFDERSTILELERRPIIHGMEGFQAVCDRYSLRVF